MSKRSIFIAVATEIEVRPLLNMYAWEKLGKDNWYMQNHSQEILIACTGIGATAMGVRTAFELSRRKFDIAVNMGIAGSYRKDLDIGSAVFVASEQFADLGIEEKDGSFQDLFAANLANPNDDPFQNGRLLNPDIPDRPFLPVVASITTNKATGSEASIHKLLTVYQPDIENMEGAGFFMACLLARVPFLEIRSISNYVTPRARENWEIDLAINKLNKIVDKMIETLEEVL